MFVYNNALLLIGSGGQIVQVCITSFFGVLALACAAQNYLGGRLNILYRLLLFFGGGCLIYPGLFTDIAGMIIVLVLLWIRVPDLLRRYTIGLFAARARA
jgi:TRAP-type uncharacterized transport system fused permease subunit